MAYSSVAEMILASRYDATPSKIISTRPGGLWPTSRNVQVTLRRFHMPCCLSPLITNVSVVRIYSARLLKVHILCHWSVLCTYLNFCWPRPFRQEPVKRSYITQKYTHLRYVKYYSKFTYRNIRSYGSTHSIKPLHLTTLDPYCQWSQLQMLSSSVCTPELISGALYE